jgi:hypothetical protein
MVLMARIVNGLRCLTPLGMKDMNFLTIARIVIATKETTCIKWAHMAYAESCWQKDGQR